MSELYVESPLAHREAPQGLSIDLREIADRGMIDLRGSAGDKKFMAAVKKVLGLDLPKAPRTSVSWGDVKALWLSIDQWLILCSRAKATELQQPWLPNSGHSFPRRQCLRHARDATPGRRRGAGSAAQRLFT